jgi:hypothetical protein
MGELHSGTNYNFVWDVGTLSWVKEVQASGGSGGGGGAVTVANGADVAQGTTTDAAITSDASGTVTGFLRGLVKMIASVWDSGNGRLKVDGSAVTQPVSGTFWQTTQPVSGTFWQATQPVSGAFFQSTQPVSAATLPLPTGAATGTKQDTGNVSVASIDTKTPALGQALAAASVPVVFPATQIATLTPPAAITGFALEAGNLAVIASAEDVARSTRLSESAFTARIGTVSASTPEANTVLDRLLTVARKIDNASRLAATEATLQKMVVALVKPAPAPGRTLLHVGLR